jgi:hypothetical protein
MLKKGKEEIIYLLNKCIEKFQLETGKSVVQNTNRKNYEELAIRLSEISNQFQIRMNCMVTCNMNPIRKLTRPITHLENMI